MRCAAEAPGWPRSGLSDQIARWQPLYSRCDCSTPRATVGGLQASWTRKPHRSVLVEMARALAWVATGAATCTRTSFGVPRGSRPLRRRRARSVDLGRVPGHGRRGRSDAGSTGCALRPQRALPEPGPPAQAATPTVGRRGLPARRRRLLAGATLSGDKISVPAEACLWCPLLGRVVDVHKPEALPVTPVPLEVVH